jgi:glutamate transport system permease protein
VPCLLAFACSGALVAADGAAHTVPLGQAEAARSIGLSFTQTLRIVVLLQVSAWSSPPSAAS